MFHCRLKQIKGIGYGIAARLGMEGATSVALVDLDQESIDDACIRLKTITGSSCRYDGHACDVTNIESVTSVWNQIAQDNDGRIDILVQAAGIVGATNLKTEDVDPENFDAVFRVNVNGIFNGCKVALPFMRRNGYGRIVNIASIAGKEGNAGMYSGRFLYSLFSPYLYGMKPVDVS